MKESILYKFDKASEEQIAVHLLECDTDFVPPLSERVIIKEYAKKISCHASRFEAWHGKRLIGLVAIYLNDQNNEQVAFITSVSVHRDFYGLGIAGNLMGRCIDKLKNFGTKQIRLEVASKNLRAVRLYEQKGFVVSGEKPPFFVMDLLLSSEIQHER